MTAEASRDQLVAALRGAVRIAFPPALGEPDLLAMLPDLLEEPVELLVPFRTRSLRLASLGSMVRARAVFGGVDVDASDYAAIQLRQLPQLMRQGPLTIDVAIVRVAPADASGMHNVGPSASLTSDLALSARTVIAEIDPDLPRTCGETAVPATAVALQVEATSPLEVPPEQQGCAATDAEQRLAALVATIVPDGAALQVGMGHAARAIPAALASHRDLRLIAGLATPELCMLADDGALDAQWAIPVGEAYGAESFMRYIDRNRRLSFQSTRDLHDVRKLGGLTHLVTVNTALAVDLLGRVASERTGGAVRGGLGGLVEFLMAGRVAEGGVNVVALTATAGSRSRIIRRLASEDVSIPASFVDFVVTEWGIADLRATTDQERAERIAEIAHPDHRTVLTNTQIEQAQEES